MPTRCINVVNFIRGVEPRFEIDLMLPVRNQMELLKAHGLPGTWLLQFDALVAGQFVDFLKSAMPESHEVGFWFEMNRPLCVEAGIEWRGRPGYDWDHYPSVAFTLGYTPDERIRLADAAFERFHTVWGRYPSSVASWNLDAVSVRHLSARYGVEAFAVCRDQIATDGFTIWGSPIAGYYPCRNNAWSPAVGLENQIDSPIFRMLGQDPVYYYNRSFRLPDGRVLSEPDTMEPVWTTGRSPRFARLFLNMIAEAPCQEFAYAQLGQENSFPWPDAAEGYPMQMAMLEKLRDAGSVHVETMGESGRRFKRQFLTTPTQAQVMLEDPMGNSDPAEGSIWYQSRHYRANLHVAGELPFLRDWFVYDDDFPQPFLNQPTRLNDVEQRMLAVLDGYHWRQTPTASSRPGAGGFFTVAGAPMRLNGKPTVEESEKGLVVALPTEVGAVAVSFDEDRATFSHALALAIRFEWDPGKAALLKVESGRVHYRWQGFDYSIRVLEGTATAHPNGWSVASADGKIVLQTGGG